MKLNKISFENFRGIKSAEINLDGKTSIIYGENGMGKSTLLDACNILFSRILKEAADDEQLDSRVIKDSDVKVGESVTHIGAEISIDGEILPYYRRRIEGKNVHNRILLAELSNALRNKYIGSYKEMSEDEDFVDNTEGKSLFVDDRDMPVYVYYGVNRHIVGRRVSLKKYTGMGGKLDAWRDQALDGIINLDLFFEWFRRKQEAENIRKLEDSAFTDKQFAAAQKAILDSLGEEFTSIKIKIIDENAEMVLVKKGYELNLKQLSEGERTVIAFVGDLARRLAIANPLREDPLSGEGIVLIDEIDLHLHPSWQARILPTLTETFPNIQFIVTTHSPKVLGGMDDGVNIIKLEEADDNIVATPVNSLNGWNVNEILEVWMGTDSLHPKTKQKINDMYACIQEKRFGEAKAIVDELERMTDGNNQEVVRGKILINRGMKNASDTKEDGTQGNH